ncbi:MAG: HAMP domain-containing histidine kinase [Candidatus Nealsonbacteria bacterium]|nr:HAMP domain-containing histidine kinase [Candidatus Nealsonbacteria bacterium]
MDELKKRFKLLLELEIRARDTYVKILKDAEIAGQDGDIKKTLELIRDQEIEHVFAARRLVDLHRKADKRKQKPEISKDALIGLQSDFIFRRTLIDTAGALLTSELSTFVLLSAFGEKSREFKKKTEERREMMAKIAHQLKTPPTISNWISEILMKELAGQMTEEQKKMIEEIRAANRSMIEFVSDLTDVYRAESIEKLSIEPVDLALLTNQEIKKLNQLAKSMGKEFVATLPAEKMQIQSNNDAIEKIASNLLLNALYYGAKKDKIIVKIEKGGDRAILSVADHGIGIPKKEQGQIFEKFFRASNARKAHREGTGLGLYITNELVKKLGGKIWFESIVGKGTTFFVEFPVK